MKKTTAAGIAGAAVLTAAGGVSAMFLTVGALSSSASPVAPTVTTEYVDTDGNPLFATNPASVGSEYGGYEDDDYEEYGEHDDYEDDDHEEYGEYEDYEDDDYEDDDHEDDDDHEGEEGDV